MKTKLLLCLLILPSFATEQASEILHVDDSLYRIRYYYPLEELMYHLNPFSDIENRTFWTSCWRGYYAEWKIENDSLFLIKINDCGSDASVQDEKLKELFIDIGIKPISSNEKIFAKWVSEELYVLEDNKLTDQRTKDMLTHVKLQPFASIKNGIISTKTE